MIAGDGGCLVEGDDALSCFALEYVRDGGGVRADGGGELFGGAAVLVPRLHYPPARHAVAPAVRVAQALQGDDLVPPVRLGEAGGALHVALGQAGGGAQHQCREAPGRDVRPLHAQGLGQVVAGAVEQLLHLDVAAVGVVHHPADVLRRRRAAPESGIAASIDYGADPELFVYAI